jgi:hypothetical protein
LLLQALTVKASGGCSMLAIAFQFFVSYQKYRRKDSELFLIRKICLCSALFFGKKGKITYKKTPPKGKITYLHASGAAVPLLLNTFFEISPCHTEQNSLLYSFFRFICKYFSIKCLHLH